MPSEQLIVSGSKDPFAGLPFRFSVPDGFAQDRTTMLDASEISFVRRGDGYRQEALGMPRIEIAKLADHPPPTRKDDLLQLYDEVAHDGHTESIDLSSRRIAGHEVPLLEASFAPFDNGRLRALILGQREIRLSTLLCPVPGIATTWALIMLGADAPRSSYLPFRQSILDSLVIDGAAPALT